MRSHNYFLKKDLSQMVNQLSDPSFKPDSEYQKRVKELTDKPKPADSRHLLKQPWPSTPNRH